MDYFNAINKILIERNWSNEDATREIYKAHKAEFLGRKVTSWSAKRFNSVKLGYDETVWLRKLVADFFGISEDLIPRKKVNLKKFGYKKRKTAKT